MRPFASSTVRDRQQEAGLLGTPPLFSPDLALRLRQRFGLSWCRVSKLFVPLILAVIASVRGVGADDGILLTVNYAATPGGVALTWTGGSPVFEVYRSANPRSEERRVGKEGGSG